MNKIKKNDKIVSEKRKMLMNKNFGFGISDFKKFREKNCFYIDKSLFIKEVIDGNFEVALITRPRRFGKSLNLSMLNYYFNINDNSIDLFKGLKILKESEKYLQAMNTYPVINLSFNGIKTENYKTMLKRLQVRISKAFKDNLYLLNSEVLSDAEKDDFEIIAYNNIPDNYKYEIADMVNFLTELLYKHHNKKVYVLLDEYDVPLIHSYVDNYYDEAIKFFKSFIRSTFKDNLYLEKGVLTGVSRVSKEGIFSDANNISVFTVLDDEFSNCFGFTKEEINEVLTKYEMKENLNDLEKWYDGYTFGNTTDIYNPLSALKYFKYQDFKPYWINTSSNDLIKKIFAKSSPKVKEDLEDLISGKRVEVKVDLNTIIPTIEEKEKNIWGLLLQAGYLKPAGYIKEKDSYFVEIPNEEIKRFYENIIEDWCYRTKNMTLNYLLDLNFTEFEEAFKRLTLEMFSYLDVNENEDENFYHAFVLGMMVELKNRYVIHSNRESGFGRYDVILKPLESKKKPAFIIEFKSCKSKTFEESIKEAKTQIENKKYETELLQEKFTNITKMAIVFKGKEVKIEIFK